MTNRRPNIIFIVADDLGYADLGCYGGRDPISPHLDRLAAGGLRLTEGYANSSVCSPTRFALITGRYQYRLRGGAEEPVSSKSRGDARLGLPAAHPTFPSLLLASGYRTALIGKWHLGFPPLYGPLSSGYQEYFGPMGGGVDYFTHCDPNGIQDLWSGHEVSPQPGYLTDLLSERAVDYVERMAGGSQPFLLSLHYTAPHWPWESRDDEALAADISGNLFHLHGGNVHTYRRMISHMDEGIGALIAALERHDSLHDTLIVFTSDNGGERFSDNWPLVGGKMDLTEGGIRVPWIAHWPAVIAAGTVSAQHCQTMDWSATVLDAAGVAADPDYPLDGLSLLPVLRDPGVHIDRPLYWRMTHRGQRAYRSGAWKYLRVDGNEYLFNLDADARERANLGSREPERLHRMRSEWEQWNATLPPIPEDAKATVGYSVKDMPSR